MEANVVLLHVCTLMNVVLKCNSMQSIVVTFVLSCIDAHISVFLFVHRLFNAHVQVTHILSSTHLVVLSSLAVY